ncbi:MAG: pyridoxal phosphate-dependent aminotransferase [Opitutales bacterium]
MPLPLSSRARDLAPSPTLSITAKAKALRADGHDVLSLAAGEPDFDTPEFLKDACAEALRRGETKYAPVPGIPALREALAAKYRERHGIPGVTSEWTVVSPGGKFSCYAALLATVGPGDEVIVPAPFWVSYPEMVKLAGAEPVIVTTSDANAYKLTPEALRQALSPRTRLLILNSPSNPTGTVYTPAELRALTEAAVEAGIYILSDEIYEDLAYDDAEIVSPASFSEAAARHVITVSGFAKTFSMTGWRLGTLVADPIIAKAVSNLQSQTTSNATTFAQYGALAALEQPEKANAAVAAMRAAFDRRRLTLLDGLNVLPGISCFRSKGAFYLFPTVKDCGLDSLTFCDRLLDEALIAAVPGVAFGEDAAIRLSYACSDETIAKCLERLERFCRQRAG